MLWNLESLELCPLMVRFYDCFGEQLYFVQFMYWCAIVYFFLCSLLVL